MVLDFMEHCLRTYYRHGIRWSEEHYYSSLCEDSKRILDFPTPTGLKLTLGKTVAPQFKSCHSLGIPTVRSIGFLFSSIPVELPPVDLADGGWSDSEKLRPSSASSANGGVPPPPLAETEPAPRDPRPYLLYGRLFEDWRLEALATKSLSDRTLFVASGLSSWDGSATAGGRDSGTGMGADPSKFTTQIFHRTPNWCGEAIYSTDDHVVGLSGLYRIQGTNWAAGSELYYTGKERSGGLSVGGRYRVSHGPNARSTLTLLASPMMGHVSSAYTTTIRPNLTMATRYDLNVYSYEADVAVGLEYAHGKTDQVVKAKISLMQGLALKLEGRYQQAVFSVGLMTQFTVNPRRSIGVEVQIF
ncbi:hypothetical protein BDK51DRAFT_32440 [Blyttiomyces helicus]|uniref:Mitochondrial distribution and morphology protein 10 n=1 Tax=Blyttiomyces helicus TaxID=388810 RepID=A0A4P9W108_9FUNG|nr:hypothetical protein BDK51DRAFT_32440 [Blyttiomyces helicus]|eukprot:RKO85322.1 hypothetical protein BDK51DRAFT_32440 [Blyttiomyces helicus]